MTHTTTLHTQRSIERFHAYAAAFESAYATDDWSVLEPFFTEDATSELNGNRVDGRAAVLASFRTSVAMFDRRFDTRRMRLTTGPTVEDGRLHVTTASRYEREPLAALEILGEEWFTFEGDRIKHHVDHVLNFAEAMEYFARNGEALRPMAA
jgi:hypothetical protein